jgi:hypothetical protein
MKSKSGIAKQIAAEKNDSKPFHAYKAKILGVIVSNFKNTIQPYCNRDFYIS